MIDLEEKAKIREHMLEARDNMSPKYKRNFDYEVCEELKHFCQKNVTKIIHCYLPIKGEINVIPFLTWALQNDIKIVCPKVMPERQLQNLELLGLDDFETGPFNTIHPAGNKVYQGQIDLIIVPGLAFDTQLNRLGYGGGYYDRFLLKYPESFKLAVQYPFQLIKEVPIEKHDVKMDELITNLL